MPPRPKVKAERRRADEAIARIRACRTLRRIGVADRQQIAVEMHGALRLAGRARREADQATSSAAVSTASKCGEASAISASRPSGVPDPQYTTRSSPGASGLCALHLVREAMVAERQADPRLGDRIGDLPGAQKRHGRHDDAARLQHREVDRHHHRGVGGAQQHPVARSRIRACRPARCRSGSRCSCKCAIGQSLLPGR